MIKQNSLEQRITSVLNRLEAVIDRENECIGVDPEFDIEQSNIFKSRCLYEITLMFRHVDPASLGESQKAHLRQLTDKLNINSEKVNAHMLAVRDIAELMKKTVFAFEADGTYSVDQFKGGLNPTPEV